MRVRACAQKSQRYVSARRSVCVVVVFVVVGCCRPCLRDRTIALSRTIDVVVVVVLAFRVDVGG